MTMRGIMVMIPIKGQAEANIIIINEKSCLPAAFLLEFIILSSSEVIHYSILHSSLLLFLYLLYLATEIFLFFSRQAFIMNERPLTSQYLFKQAIRVPVYTSLYFGFFCWFGHTPQFDAQGFERFLEISKLPIGFFSLTIPFVIIVNNMHRTIQIDTQIQESRKKNILDSFYSQQKFAVQFFNNLPAQGLSIDVKGVGIINKSYKIDYSIHLYRMLFNDSSPQLGASYEPNHSFIHRIDDNVQNISEKLKALTGADPEQLEIQSQALFQIELNLSELSKLLCIKWPVSMLHLRYIHSDFDISTRFLSHEDLAETVSILYSFTIDILEFSGPLDFNNMIAKPQNTVERIAEYLLNNKPAIFDKLAVTEGYIEQGVMSYHIQE